ncbi:PD40 domain-containing protein [Haliangium ochraceum]|uniref:Uncharacterized protein n=1 Tax=Haliangium ochraceum (strain DSM 14365 / JCM 11303 / SMP-2) TaxID=502025 RepID=D0LS90_HALO1|nr:PD40 domain-containing protein [Haliangium ochraceum]ACY15589.1 hypothetical protein Hoch_3083 [Haliangium ochraceum DSM 14365]
MLAALALSGACSDDDGSSGPGDADAAAPDAPALDAGADAGADPDAAPAAPSRVQLAFERVSEERSFHILATALDQYGDPIAADIELSSDRGELAPSEPEGLGVRALVTPDQLGGRYRIEAQVADGSLSASGEVLVLAHVDERWDQPVVVDGLVNTAGWEDGPAISADGQWLFIQYLPVPLNCVIGGDSSAPACAVARGPVSAPERPGMPGAERVAEDGTIDHSCPSFGFFDAPFPVAPNALYGFRRQPDDSFAEPFLIAWEGVDGCVSAFGASLAQQGEPSTLLYAYDMPLDNGPGDSVSDIFAAEVTLGQDILLGRYVDEGSGVVERDVLGTLLAGTRDGQQGNPHLWTRGSDDHVLFHDDEQTRHDILIVEGSGPLQSASWGTATALPEAVNSAGEDESQPFFDGETLWFRREQTLMAADFSGGSLTDASAWSSARVELEGTPLAPDTGAILAIGEPTVAELDGRRELYFIFAERVADGTFNLDVARVASRP